MGTHTVAKGDGHYLIDGLRVIFRPTRPLDVLMMDPPYRSGAGAVALDRLARLGWVGPASWVTIETERP